MTKRTSLLALLIASTGCELTPSPTEPVATASAAVITTGDVIYDGNPATACTVGGVTMHCCPSGRAMIGIRNDRNTFKCARLGVAGGAISLSGVVRNNMLSCPSGQVAVGFHGGQNRLACQALPGTTFGPEIVDNPGAVDGFPMLVCRPTDGYTMTGVDLTRNLVSCINQAGISTSTVTASITVDVGSVPPQQGCGSASFLLDGAPMTFQGSQLLQEGIFRCRYSAVKAGVPLGGHTVTVPDFNACRTFSASASSTSVTVLPFQCF